MLAIFSKNCVLMGDLDSYCLICSMPLTGDVLEHIRSPKHNAKLKPAVYFEKYKNDFIKKVNEVYFCEICNKTFATAAKVGMHVTEETHVTGRRRQLTRVGTSIILQKDTLIEENAWNGLVENTCVVCNVDFDDPSTHMSERSHALNVVGSTVTIDDDNNIYRKVDGGYQCLTCNKVVPNTEVSKHLDSKQHKAARVSLGCNRDDADNNNIDQRNEEKIEQTKENEVNGDETKDVDIKVFKENASVAEVKTIKKPSVSEELEACANKHGLFLNQDNYNLVCQICGATVPGSINNVIEHIAGKKHTDNIKRQAEANKELNTMKIEKVLPKYYFRRILIVNYVFKKYAIINDSFCVEFNNFFCLLDIGKIICQLCDLEVTPENRIMHLTSASHALKLRNAFVITSLKEEFVRQINSLYHCGICGVFQKDFGHMLDHLSTPVHLQQKVTNKKIFERIKDEKLLNRYKMELNLVDFGTFQPVN